MQDLFIHDVFVHESGDENSTTTKLTKEKLLNSPIDMYLYSLSTKQRLPDELHEAMLLWSFDIELNEYVKSYLSWIKTCEERKLSREKFEKQMQFQEKFIKITLVVLSITLGYILIFN